MNWTSEGSTKWHDGVPDIGGVAVDFILRCRLTPSTVVDRLVNVKT